MNVIVHGNDAAAGASAATADALGCSVKPRPTVETPTAGADKADPVATAALVLAVPPFLLATWDLADRLRLVERAKRWLAALRALPESGRIELDLPGAGRKRLEAVEVGDVLEAANAKAPSLVVEREAWDAFIIHAGPDRSAARDIWEALKLAGVHAYLDRAEIRPGDNWPARLQQALQNTRVFVVLVSDTWAEGWYNHAELAEAVRLVRANSERALIPVVLAPGTERGVTLPYGLEHVQPLDLSALAATERMSAVVSAVQDVLDRASDAQ